MSIFSRRNKIDNEAEVIASVARLEQRINAFERAVGQRGFHVGSSMFRIGSDGCVVGIPSITDELETIKSHIGISIKPNPDADKKWIAEKVAKK